ncbi:hypothetical protein IV203_014915 [Nitzschia inconspicua]|uniref:Elongator complex protein 5 n=1 Tax=Nitzschia inconspicua TaxID=303405 RepID=A0A9K3L9X0_9STRA|nr:hypothetical protein IV203_014915 [Nitzschia inconspicua]
MKKKTVTSGSSPVASIFSQWIARQQKLLATTPPTTPNATGSDYRILLQQSFSLSDRIAAAQPVENAQVYRRAGQLMPSEVATKDMLGGHAWLLHLIELSAAAVTKSAAVALDSGGTIAAPKMVLISTLPQDGTELTRHLSHDQEQHVDILELASLDPFGWDTIGDAPNDATNDITKRDLLSHNLTLSDLRSLYEYLRQPQSEASNRRQPTIVIWQSLTPLIQFHGFQKTLKFLRALPGLQVWITPISCLTPFQHAALEDAANCLLQVQNGHATFLKQGVREPGNVQRETIMYELRAVRDETDGAVFHRVVEGAEVSGKPEVEDITDQETLRKAMDALDVGKAISSSNTGIATKLTTNASDRNTSRGPQPKMKLQLEEETKIEKSSSKLQQRPRIYMDDDDPEFNDLDEEDPDDDLDI